MNYVEALPGLAPHKTYTPIKAIDPKLSENDLNVKISYSSLR